MPQRAKALIWPIRENPNCAKRKDCRDLQRKWTRAWGQSKGGSAYSTISYPTCPPPRPNRCETEAYLRVGSVV
jgi:hypothetical protein